jgi:hypothetical protein
MIPCAVEEEIAGLIIKAEHSDSNSSKSLISPHQFHCILKPIKFSPPANLKSATKQIMCYADLNCLFAFLMNLSQWPQTWVLLQSVPFSITLSLSLVSDLKKKKQKIIPFVMIIRFRS